MMQWPVVSEDGQWTTREHSNRGRKYTPILPKKRKIVEKRVNYIG